MSSNSPPWVLFVQPPIFTPNFIQLRQLCQYLAGRKVQIRLLPVRYEATRHFDNEPLTIHYCWVRGESTEIAQAVRQNDPQWHAPILWRSELRSVLIACLRRGLLTRPQIVGILRVADRALAERERIIPDDLVLDVVASSTLTAHDASSSRLPLLYPSRW